MKALFLTIALLSVTACAQLTGDPVKDCLAATNMVNTAQVASTLANTIAALNPQSERMQQSAVLAQTTLTIAVSQQVRACPAI